MHCGIELMHGARGYARATHMHCMQIVFPSRVPSFVLFPFARKLNSLVHANA